MILTQYETIRGASALPINETDVKIWISRDPSFTDDDEKISLLIMAAVEAFQGPTGRKICDQRITWHPWRFGDRDYERSPGREMHLPFGNNRNLVIEYRDHDGIIQTWPATEYRVNASENSNYILALEYEKTWPDPESTMSDSISITFDCGWPVGNVWLPGHDYIAGDMTVPTKLKQRGMAYVCTTGGTSGTAEPVFTTLIGGETTDNTVIWECVGKTVPSDIRSALLAYCAERIKEPAITKEYPNLNILSLSWEKTISDRTLRLA